MASSVLLHVLLPIAVFACIIGALHWSIAAQHRDSGSQPILLGRKLVRLARFGLRR
jgi:type II secretory pathway component PulK